MKKLILLLSLLILIPFVSADHHKDDRGDKRMKMWQAKLKVDLAELKGPPALSELEEKKANRVADLDLLINSGKYKEGELKRIKAMREKLMERELPSQEMLNERHDRRLKMAQSKMRSRGEMMHKKHRNDAHNRDMRDRNQWERRNRPRRK